MQIQGKQAWKAVAAIGALVAAGCVEGADARVVSSGRASAAAIAPAVNGTIRFAVADSGNVARYRVRERLMGKELDNDAVGEGRPVARA